MKVQLPVIVKDPEVSDWKGVSPTEMVEVDTEAQFLAGPISPRVAILDFDPATGRVTAPVAFIPPSQSSGVGQYRLNDPVGLGTFEVSPEAAAVSVFGTIFKTIRLFEEPDSLGRPITWAFDSPQLLVVPRAGEWANAFYERESGSLQFFYFAAENGRRVYTAHSQDIVAHETAHAILDGMAPDLYHATTPQSLAIHEAVADLTALLCSFRSAELVREVLQQTQGSIFQSNAFAGIAEQFAKALDEQRHYLRSLNNTKSLAPSPGMDKVASRSDPHELSEVLSGALYSVLMGIYGELRAEYDTKGMESDDVVARPEATFNVQQAQQYSTGPRLDLTAAEKALFVASERLKRTLLRGLDYLPPGDATFADLGRAILAADEASHPDSEGQRSALRAEFVRRGIVQREHELDTPSQFDNHLVASLDIDGLVESDYVAYRFVEAQRKLLKIPAGMNYEVRPRLKVTRKLWHREGEETVTEVLVKVGWTQIEANPVPGLAQSRRLNRGATLSIGVPRDGGPPTIRAVVVTRSNARDRTDRTEFVRRLVSDEILQIGDNAVGFEGRPRRGVIRGDELQGVLRVRGTSRTLHVTGEML